MNGEADSMGSDTGFVPRDVRLNGGTWRTADGGITADRAESASSDPRTIEQNQALQQMYGDDGQLGRQYAASFLLPSGHLSRDWSAFPADVTTPTGPVNVDIEEHLFALDRDGYVVSVIAVGPTAQPRWKRRQLAAYAASGEGDVSVGVARGMARAEAVQLVCDGYGSVVGVMPGSDVLSFTGGRCHIAAQASDMLEPFDETVLLVEEAPEATHPGQSTEARIAEATDVADPDVGAADAIDRAVGRGGILHKRAAGEWTLLNRADGLDQRAGKPIEHDVRCRALPTDTVIQPRVASDGVTSTGVVIGLVGSAEVTGVFASGRSFGEAFANLEGYFRRGAAALGHAQALLE